jgi:UDP-3-O-[3-hydroxymyristoyl] glucosamine N-acyltransferase
MSAYTVQQLADLVAGKVEGDASRRVEGVASVDRAGPTDLTFVMNERYAQRLQTGAAGACLVTPDLQLEANGTVCIRVENPSVAPTLESTRRRLSDGVRRSGAVRRSAPT